MSSIASLTTSSSAFHKTGTSTTSYSYSYSYSYSAAPTSSYSVTFVPVISDEFDPYVMHYNNKNGTVFIAVGTIILSLLLLLSGVRFWYWLKYRKVAKEATNFDDYYGGGNDSTIFFDDDKDNFLAYDIGSYNNENNKRNSNGLFLSSPNGSQYSHSINSSNSSFDSINNNSNNNLSASSASNHNLSNLTSQPGRNLRNAFTQSYIPPRTRSSFISPINQLIQEQYSSIENIDGSNKETTISSSSSSSSSSPSQLSSSITPSPSPELHRRRLSSAQILTGMIDSPKLTLSSSSPPISSNNSNNFRKRKTQSISLLINQSTPRLNNNDNNIIDGTFNSSHSRSTSLDLHELEKMIHKSLAKDSNSNNNNNNNNNNGTPKQGILSSNSQSSDNTNKVKDFNNGEEKKRSRPPSLVLDMLVNEKDI
ncbi:hypothetical protein C6P40_004770 [Pichia californica]|uniref:Uncharacterized protein n=1 Tax=Pichia californica TaxID=460514 RepID=A0A9P7BG55_9ASCO|nr:hypothetical protein C6P42_005143 [[Candida] californica]KAG0689611.1 hypothetical protein C6P40_004770 [[Candida] californica]